jgi:hypothetical protein
MRKEERRFGLGPKDIYLNRRVEDEDKVKGES